MRLLRKLIVPVLVAVAASCSDSTSPSVTKSFYLDSVDGRSVPVTDTLISGTLVLTTVSGSLTLHGDGTATVLQRSRRIDVGVDSLEYTDSVTLRYQIDGDSIGLGARVGPCHDICRGSYHGAYSPSQISLTNDLTPAPAPVLLFLETPQ